VAIKVAKDAFTERFEREARAIAALDLAPSRNATTFCL